MSKTRGLEESRSSQNEGIFETGLPSHDLQSAWKRAHEVFTDAIFNRDPMIISQYLESLPEEIKRVLTSTSDDNIPSPLQRLSIEANFYAMHWGVRLDALPISPIEGEESYTRAYWMLNIRSEHDPKKRKGAGSLILAEQDEREIFAWYTSISGPTMEVLAYWKGISETTISKVINKFLQREQAKPEFKVSDETMPREEYLRFGQIAASAITTLTLTSKTDKLKMKLCTDLLDAGLSMPWLRRDILATLKTVLTESITTTNWDELLAAGEEVFEKLQELPDSLVESLPNAADLDVPSILMLTHDLRNILGSATLANIDTLSQSSTVVDQVLKINALTLQYVQTGRYSESVVHAFRQIAIHSARYLDDYLASLPQDQRIPEYFEVRSTIHTFAGLDPVIEDVSLPDEVTWFLKDRTFQNKNESQLPVVPIIDIKGDIPDVLLDRGILFRILRNLLNDVAAHGASVGDHIPARITIKKKGAMVILSVTNPGYLPKEILMIIGKEHYTRQDDDRIHGTGKINISVERTRELSALGVMGRSRRAALRQWRVKHHERVGSYKGNVVEWRTKYLVRGRGQE